MMLLFTLFGKECRRVLRSWAYLVFVVIVMLFYHMQIGTTVSDQIRGAQADSGTVQTETYNPLRCPTPESGTYGTIKQEVPGQIMPELISRLVRDVQDNRFSTFPLGFHRSVHLKQTQLDTIREILSDCTGCSYAALQDMPAEDIPIVCSYDTFRAHMQTIEDMIGPTSSYAYASYSQISSVPRTYAEAQAEYTELVECDQVSGAYARLYCDYMNIIALFFSVCVSVSVLLRDERCGISKLLYARQIRSRTLISVRYAAHTVMLLLPFLLTALVPSVYLAVFGIRAGITINLLAYPAMILLWILPSILISTAVGFLTSCLLQNYLGILLCTGGAFVSLVTSVQHISDGVYTLNPMVRFNRIGGYSVFHAGFSDFLANRLFYAGLALALLCLTIWIYDRRRRGAFYDVRQMRTAFDTDAHTDEAFND